jgi:hypothetical protein
MRRGKLLRWKTFDDLLIRELGDKASSIGVEINADVCVCIGRPNPIALTA